MVIRRLGLFSTVDISAVQLMRQSKLYDSSGSIEGIGKIEIVKRLDQTYRMSHAVTARQKAILKAFDITAEDIRKQAIMIGRETSKDGRCLKQN